MESKKKQDIKPTAVAATSLLEFTDHGVDVIRVNNVFFDLPNSEKEYVLNEVEKWIATERKSIPKSEKVECNCCHRRSVNIVKEYGMCVECLCSEEFNWPKFTKRQREFVIGNVNMLLVALAIFCIYKLTGDSANSANKIASLAIMWFVYFTLASILIIYIYNQVKESLGDLKNEIRKFIDLGALMYFQS